MDIKNYKMTTKKYCCETCNYATSSYSHLIRHNQTIRHLNGGKSVRQPKIKEYATSDLLEIRDVPNRKGYEIRFRKWGLSISCYIAYGGDKENAFETIQEKRKELLKRDDLQDKIREREKKIKEKNNIVVAKGLKKRISKETTTKE